MWKLLQYITHYARSSRAIGGTIMLVSVTVSIVLISLILPFERLPSGPWTQGQAYAAEHAAPAEHHGT